MTMDACKDFEVLETIPDDVIVEYLKNKGVLELSSTSVNPTEILYLSVNELPDDVDDSSGVVYTMMGKKVSQTLLVPNTAKRVVYLPEDILNQNTQRND